jgi:hypothetical protein
MGHADETMANLCYKIQGDVEFRKEWAEKCGFDFELPSVVQNAPKKTESDAIKKAA